MPVQFFAAQSAAMVRHCASSPAAAFRIPFFKHVALQAAKWKGVTWGEPEVISLLRKVSTISLPNTLAGEWATRQLMPTFHPALG